MEETKEEEKVEEQKVEEQKVEINKEEEKKEEDKKEEAKKEEEKKEEDKKEEDKKEEDKKEEDKKEEPKEEDEKTKKKREKEEKLRKKKEKEKEEKERKKKEKEEKLKKKKEKEDQKKKEKEDKKKEDDKIKEKVNIIYSIDEQNKKCVDCGADNPTKVSINNGVIICEKCAKEHEELGHSISFLKNIEDDFDQFLINFIVMGSNTKFKRFLSEEKVDENLPIKSKYKTKAVYFYRKNLKAKTEGKNELEKDFKEANELIEDEENIFPEFDKKYVIKNQVLRKGNVISQDRFTFRNIFLKVFNRNKKKRGRSFNKNKKKKNSNIDVEIDMNKTSPPEIIGAENKEANIMESNRPFQDDDKKEDKKEENITRSVNVISTGLK